MAKRQVVLLGLALALAGNGRAQQQSEEQKVLGELFSGDASVQGSVLLRAQATQVLSGSQITAGEGSAVLKLRRGGQVRICPRTNLSLSADASGKALSLGLNAGSMELQYRLDSGGDSLLTPDFRLQLISPGTFHLAISVGASGDTCLRSLPGADAAVFVTEMMGSESYQLSPGRKVLFRDGKIAQATEAPENCGCPEAPPAQITVAESSPQGARSETAPADTQPRLQEPERHAEGAANHSSPQGAEAAKADHLEMESRFAYGGDAAELDYYTAASRLSLSSDNSRLALAFVPQVSPPVEESAPKPQLRPASAEAGGGFLHRFFKRLFGR